MLLPDPEGLQPLQAVQLFPTLHHSVVGQMNVEMWDCRGG